MSGLAKKWVESFRALPQGLRDELLAKIVVDDKSVSSARLERIALILDRHVFRAETPRELCKNLKLSRQQFYADLREGVRRLNVLLDRKEHGSSAVVLYNPRELIVSQAHAAYHAGMSRRAADLLQRIHSAPLRAIEAAEAAALELEVFEDLMRPLASFHTGLDLIADARAQAENGSNDDERAIFTATMHWIQTYLSCYAGDRSRFLREYDEMVALLRSRAFGGHRDAAVAFCRFTLSALLLLEDFDQGYLDGARAERALADVNELLRMRDDMPMTMAASLQARYAAFYNGRATTAQRSREARALAYKHGIDRASTVSVWYALGMEVTDNLARGETAHALACATALHESVQASDSIEWQLPARSRLALAFNAVGRFDDAERTISIYEARRVPYRPHAIIPTCEMLLGRGRYRECAELATLLVENVKGMHHASALVYRAKAAYQIGDAKSAAADIKTAVAMCDSLHGQSFYRVCSAYRAAYEITGEKRYRDTLHAIETLLEDDAFNTPLMGAARGLTTRQREIARLAASGETNRAIARKLGLSPRTVGNSLNAIYERLGVRARWQLADALQESAVRSNGPLIG